MKQRVVWGAILISSLIIIATTMMEDDYRPLARVYEINMTPEDFFKANKYKDYDPYPYKKEGSTWKERFIFVTTGISSPSTPFNGERYAQSHEGEVNAPGDPEGGRFFVFTNNIPDSRFFRFEQ